MHSPVLACCALRPEALSSFPQPLREQINKNAEEMQTFSTFICTDQGAVKALLTLYFLTPGIQAHCAGASHT